MKICVTFALFSILYIGARAEPDNEVKRGIFPFMGFVYYQDSSVISESGERFIRAAILIKPSWVLSAALDHGDAKLVFPQKTLLARFGGITIDANFNFNEDEEEQEREIIQIVQPRNFTSSQWWFYDITLLKTLLPFNTTSVVAPIYPHYKRDMNVSSCKILVYSRRTKTAEEKILMQLSVELLYPSTDCGVHYDPETMICAADSDDNKNFNYDGDYCQGNGGGPLLCEGEVTALQTYVNNCGQPHLFHLLAAWENFIDCGIKETCAEEKCRDTCTALNKDTPANEIVAVTDTTIPMERATETESETSYMDTTIASTTEKETEKVSVASEEIGDTVPTLTLQTTDPTSTNATTLTMETTTGKQDEEPTTTYATTTGKANESTKEAQRSEDSDSEIIDRQGTVEAQQQMVITRARGSGNVAHLPQSIVSLLIFRLVAAQ